MRAIVFWTSCVLAVGGGALVACGGGDGAYDGSEDGDDDGGPDPTPTAVGTPDPPDPGQLTAGDFDDNLNYGWYVAFADYFQQEFPSYPIYAANDRVTIRVQDAQGAAVPGAHVTISAGTDAFFSGPTGTDGRLLFLPTRDGAPPEANFDVSITTAGSSTSESFEAPDGNVWAFTVSSPTPLPSSLDLAFVVDATGSMGDEMSYLKTEVDSIAAYVENAFPEVDVRYGLVVYRDDGDEYVVRSFDFSDLQSFQASLGAQHAAGGGDWPEALDRALEAGSQLSWRSGSTTRVAFLIADAPAHEQYVPAFYDQVDVARELGIRYYPVAASGTMGDAEYLFRVLAQATLGRFLFLTDDSGIGLGHFDPHIPCYQVQYLNQLVARMIVTELAGVRIEAEPETILRTVGNYDAGVCMPDSQQRIPRMVQAPLLKHANGTQ